MPSIVGATFAVQGIIPAYLGALLYVAPMAGMFALMSAWNRWWNDRRGRIRADESGLWLDDRCLVARASLRHGYVRQEQDRYFVRLGRMLRLVDVEVANDEDGQALLSAMRLDAARSVAQFPMHYGTWRSAWIGAGLMLVAFGILIGILYRFATTPEEVFAVIVPAAIVANVYALNDFVRVAVGADGIRVRRLLARARFVPFAAIDNVDTDDRDIEIRLRDGRRIHLHHPSGRGWKPLLFRDRALEGRKLVERLKEQLAAHRSHAGADGDRFLRAGRDTHAWMRSVAEASDTQASFRAPAVPVEALWRLVEDTTAPQTVRAGAALALREHLDDVDRARLRVNADACVAAQLRVALESVASKDDAEHIERAFDRLVDDQT